MQLNPHTLLYCFQGINHSCHESLIFQRHAYLQNESCPESWLFHRRAYPQNGGRFSCSAGQFGSLENCVWPAEAHECTLVWAACHQRSRGCATGRHRQVVYKPFCSLKMHLLTAMTILRFDCHGSLAFDCHKSLAFDWCSLDSAGVRHFHIAAACAGIIPMALWVVNMSIAHINLWLWFCWGGTAAFWVCCRHTWLDHNTVTNTSMLILPEATTALLFCRNCSSGQCSACSSSTAKARVRAVA